ncbi:PREDICTED: ovochymase-2 isoform X1 [Gavialis gangeticus]|uniref:ovochymase-2 isoform X1 n=1 Tax=Gavialis gangeticus TaxID=94835 RepID=UPI00092FA252|nr:PREDICTED: ovochymase-2 isoform X1 [Gavialis gangeticus]
MPVALHELLLFTIGIVYLTDGNSALLSVRKDPRCGQKPHETKPWSYFNLLTRIVGGNQVEQGSHPWQVSLKRRQRHFCGGTIVSAQWVVTAAHCVVDRYILDYLNVTAGEYDLSLEEEEEQTLPVESIIKHPNFNPGRPMNYDIALVKLKGSFRFSPSVVPACLPDPDEKFDPGYICTTCGWGRLRENGNLPQVLHEVNLPILNYKECSRILLTLRKPIQGDTLMCAGFPDGGKDACQGDSGGPLLCRRKHGAWTLAGVTSWGMGCARGWINNLRKNYDQRGSPGVFTDLRKVLSWIHGKINADLKMKSSTASCSSQDGKLRGNEGSLRFPESPKHFYENNQLCVWTLLVPKGMHILLNFSHFDVEPDTFCDYDSLLVYSKDDRLVGKFCGDDPPLPILVGYNSMRLKFVSDNKEYGAGFSMTYKAVSPDALPDSGCGSLAVLFKAGVIQSIHYPEPYSNLAQCHWIIHAPEDHVILLTYQSFETEENEDCSYDSVTVYEDSAKEEEIAKSCGFAVPPPVLSFSNVMLIIFKSDETETFGGFRATVSFIHMADLNVSDSNNETTFLEDVHVAINETEIPDYICGVPLNQPRFLFSRIVGGEEAVPYSWPWQVSIQISAEHVCGGAVFAKDWVVTAAHCFSHKEQYKDLWMVVAGLHDITEQEHSQKRSVKQYIMHPNFNKTTMDSDIALLQLTEPLKFNHYVRPVCLPEEEEEVQPSQVCTITGWGAYDEDREKTKKLQQLEVPILVLETCQKYYVNHSGKVTQRMFCAGFPQEEGKDSCTGDSGGPLVCPSEDSGFYTLNGIISWGFGCGRKGYPGVYTNVAVFMDWINQHMSSGKTQISSSYSDFQDRS